MNAHYDGWTLGEWIDHFLNKEQRSGSWLARQLQRHPATISRWRMGESTPHHVIDIIRLADVLGIVTNEERDAFFVEITNTHNAQRVARDVRTK